MSGLTDISSVLIHIFYWHITYDIMYTITMKNTNDTSLFTGKDLNSMNKEELARLCRLLQKQNSSLQNQHDTLKKKQDELEKKQKLLEEQMKELEFINAMLSDRLSVAKRNRFGSSSEKWADGYEQLGLFDEAEAESDLTAAEPEFSEIAPKAYKRKKCSGKKEEDLSRFPVTTVVKNQLEGEDRYCSCGCGGHTKMKIAFTETKKTLEFIPARFEVKEEITYVYSCPKCSLMKRPPKTPGLLDGGIASPSLVAGIMNAKYVNGMPLARQSREFARYDLEISTRTMANWMIRCGDRYLKPLWNLMKQEFLKSPYKQCDETRIQVLNEPDQKAETQNWMWVYMTGKWSGSPKMVLFEYQRTRSGYHPKEFLEGTVKCHLTCDGYQPYHSLDGSITVTGCLAHSRRRFEKCLKLLQKDYTKEQLKETTAYQAMTRIGMLYKIEELTADKTPEERYQERQKQSRPLVDALFEWLHTLENKVNRSSMVGEAVLYTLGQEEYLRRFLEDGHVPIDNNDCERALKNFAIGRRNWLFSKSIDGAEASAVIYSITETAMLNGLRPYHYLTHVLDSMRRLPDFPTDDQLKTLLPWSPEIPEECRVQLKK